MSPRNCEEDVGHRQLLRPDEPAALRALQGSPSERLRAGSSSRTRRLQERLQDHRSLHHDERCRTQDDDDRPHFSGRRHKVKNVCDRRQIGWHRKQQRAKTSATPKSTDFASLHCRARQSSGGAYQTRARAERRQASGRLRLRLIYHRDSTRSDSAASRQRSRWPLQCFGRRSCSNASA